MQLTGDGIANPIRNGVLCDDLGGPNEISVPHETDLRLEPQILETFDANLIDRHAGRRFRRDTLEDHVPRPVGTSH